MRFPRSVTIDRRGQTMMFVNDTGVIDGKSVNRKASAVSCVCRPKTVWKIHGDVVIVPSGGLA
jgi:hypothetical protein